MQNLHKFAAKSETKLLKDCEAAVSKKLDLLKTCFQTVGNQVEM